MRIVPFVKMVAAGNDFVVIEEPVAFRDLKAFARKACDRRFGIGADGILLVGKSRVADVRMRILNADGTEAEMCGNGARCVARYAAMQRYPSAGKSSESSHASRAIAIQTKAGIINAVVTSGPVKIRLTAPIGLKLDMPLLVGDRLLRVHSINTGVPHVGVFVHGLGRIDVEYLGRRIRSHACFAPKGANVNFIEVLDSNTIAVRTYERGVEAETLAAASRRTRDQLGWEEWEK